MNVVYRFEIVVKAKISRPARLAIEIIPLLELYIDPGVIPALLHGGFVEGRAADHDGGERRVRVNWCSVNNSLYVKQDERTCMLFTVFNFHTFPFLETLRVLCDNEIQCSIQKVSAQNVDSSFNQP